MIKSGHVEEMTSSGIGPHVAVEMLDTKDSTVRISIDSLWFSSGDIKQLRKFLKKLQKQLEGNQQSE